MKKNFPTIMGWLAVYEGGFVNHPRDPGGATNRGVTQRVYDAFRRRQGVATQSVRHLTDAEHDAIYRQQYWNPVRGDDLPSGLDATVFDFAVNSGVSRASKYLQRALRAKGQKVAVDGIIGEMTLDAINTVARRGGLADLIIYINERRFAFVRQLSTFDVFGKGWTRRIMGERMGVQAGDIGVIDRSIMLARGDTPAAIPKPRAPAPGPASGTDLRGLPALFEAIGDFLEALFGGRRSA
jgi:lysozyme family protein